MKKYEQYKNSGVEWLGEIPAHWETKRIKHLFKEINERSFDGSEDLLSVSQYTGVTNKSERLEEGGMLTNASTLEGYKKVTRDDLVSNIMLAWNGSLGFSQFDGITSPAYSIYRLKTNDVNRYFHYLLRTELYKSEFKRNSSGVIESRLRLYTDDFFRIESILPPIQEQTAIAHFLDDKTTKIDQAIAIKQKQIELLKERRQILIHKAVTRGLDDRVKLKDSGVDWIGEIPVHWELKRLKYISNIVLGKMLCNEDKGNYKLKPYLKSKNIQWLNVEVESVDEMWFSEKEMMDYRLKRGDLILSEGGEVGKTCIWNNELDECYIQNSAHKVTVYNDNISEYYIYIFYTIGKFGVFDSIINRVSIGHLTKDKLSNIEIINPPKEEQKQIVEFIETAATKIAKAISLKEQEIEKLKEYKMNLIDGVVTGKVKVC
ncbi:MAG: restriction endonuclease subunit S [Flavobacterium sp.]